MRPILWMLLVWYLAGTFNFACSSGGTTDRYPPPPSARGSAADAPSSEP